MFSLCGTLHSPCHPTAKSSLAGTLYGHAFALLHPALGALLGMAYFLTLAGDSYERLASRPIPDVLTFAEILAVIRSLR